MGFGCFYADVWDGALGGKFANVSACGCTAEFLVIPNCILGMVFQESLGTADMCQNWLIRFKWRQDVRILIGLVDRSYGAVRYHEQFGDFPAYATRWASIYATIAGVCLDSCFQSSVAPRIDINCSPLASGDTVTIEFTYRGDIVEIVAFNGKPLLPSQALFRGGLSELTPYVGVHFSDQSGTYRLPFFSAPLASHAKPGETFRIELPKK